MDKRLLGRGQAKGLGFWPWLGARWLAWACLLAWAGPLGAQTPFRVDITGVGATQVPLVMPPWSGESAAPQAFSRIVAADLALSGWFREVPDATLGEAVPDFTAWRRVGADAALTGAVRRLADGRWDVQAQLWDVLQGQSRWTQAWVAPPADLRWVAHQVADAVMAQLTGEAGDFTSRIAYVVQQGGQHQLWIADSDGEGRLQVLSATTPLMSPRWSPDGETLAYVAFESGKAEGMVLSLRSGARRTVAGFKGSNSSPAWSSDGQSLLFTLTQGGSSQLYWVPAQGGAPNRFTRSPGIDTEAVVTADGASVFFVSDRGGSPQIYRSPRSGERVERVTFQGSYNISPAPRPDGQALAYIARVEGGAMRLHALPLNGGSPLALSTTDHDESPSFSPSGRAVLYATRSPQGRSQLVRVSTDGRVTAVLNAPPGRLSDPAWGPRRRP